MPLKVPFSLLRNLVIIIIIYLDDMLLMTSSLEDLLIPRNTLIFILQHLGFLINVKSYLEQTSTKHRFLRVIVDSGKMSLRLFKEKLLNAQNHCQKTLEKGKVTVGELSKLICRLSSTATTALPAPFHYDHIQHQQIQKLICYNTFKQEVAILVETRKELLWWKENLTLCNRRSLTFPLPQIIISSDASLQGWGAGCHDLEKGEAMVYGRTKVSHKCVGAKGTQISYNVLHIKGKRCNISLHPHGQYNSRHT